MANLKDVIYLSAEDYNTLYTNGAVTINGITITYDANNLYIVPDDSISLSSLKSLVAVCNDFSDFKTAIAAL